MTKFFNIIGLKKTRKICHTIVFVSAVILLFSCTSSRAFINFNEVKQGAHLFIAQEIEVDSFLMIWIENVQHSKVDFNLNELYKDSIYTYFGKQTFKYQNFYKILNNELNKVDYKSIVGDSIRERFYHDIIPYEDRNKRGQKGCTFLSISIKYSYSYLEDENSLEIKCHYKVVCDYIDRIIKKDYKALYDIQKRTLKKI